MPRPKGPGPQPSHKDAVELLRRFDVGRLRKFLDQVFPTAEARQIGASLLELRCQTGRHADVHPSMHIDVRRGYVECKPCGYATRDILRFLQDCRGWSYADGLRELQAATGIRVVGDKLAAAFEALDVHRLAVTQIAWAVNAYLCRMLSPPEGDSNYDKVAQHAASPSLSWLFEQRGRRKDLVYALPYGLWPPRHHLLEMCAERLVFLANEQYGVRQDTHLTEERRQKILTRISELAEAVGPEWTNAVVYVTGHDPQTVARIRLRRPDLEDRKQGNIIVLPSCTGEPGGEPNGWFGLWAPHLAGLRRGDARTFRMLMVEGENDTLSVQEGLLATNSSGWLCIGSCGNANETDALLGAGFSTVYAVSDHPGQDVGRGEAWLMPRLSTAHELDVRVFVRWAKLASGDGFVKDPDDVIRTLGFEHFRKIVLDDVENAFVAADVWASDVATEAGRDLPDVRARTQVAVKYGECLGHPAQLASYVERVALSLEVTPGIVRAQIAQGRDDEEGLLARVADVLLHDLQLLYKTESVRGARIHAYHRASHRPVEFPVDDGKATLAALANVCEQGYDYFRDRVGLPTWLTEGMDGTLIREIQKPIADYTQIAVQRIFHGLPSREECTYFGLGPHLIPEQGAPGNVVQRYNCGTHVYSGVHEDEERMRWDMLAGPAEGLRVYSVHPQSWSRCIHTVDDLNWGNQVSLDELSSIFHNLTDIIHNGWCLKRDRDEAILLAGLLFQFAVPHFCEEKNIVSMLGPQASGKSTLTALFSGGQYPHMRLLDPVSYQSDYTVASLSHAFECSSLLMTLEEFTKGMSSAAKTKQVENVTEFLRQVIFPGGATIKRVYPSGPRTFKIHTNVMTTSIRPATDAQDASRRLEIEMKKQPGFADPQTVLMRTVPAPEFLRWQRAINLGLPKFYIRYLRHYQEVAAAIATNNFVSFPVETRFLRNFLGVGAMVAMLGGDWQSLIKAHILSRRDQLDAYAYATPTYVLLDMLLRTPIRLGNAQISALALLSEKDKAPLLNTSGCGLFYFEAAGLLLVDWITTLSQGGVLSRAEGYSKEPYHTVKYQLDQHPQAVPVEEYANLGVSRFLSAYGVLAEKHTISVLRIGDRVADIRRARPALTPPTTEETPEESGEGTPVIHNESDLPPGLRGRRANNF